MPLHLWSVLCKKSVINPEDNQISLFDIIEGITVFVPDDDSINNDADKILIDASKGKTTASLPGFGENVMHLVSFWWREKADKPEKGVYRIRIVSPMNKCVHQKELEIDLENNDKVRSRIIFQSFPFNGFGRYNYIIQLKKETKKNPKWETVSKLLFEIKRGKEQI